MKLMKELKLLVIVGAWNRNIFTPDWIKRYLLPKDNFTTEASIGIENSHRISTDKIRIEFHDNRLNFIPRTHDLEIYELISNLSIKTADYLPHTPVSGYGVNFLFECKNGNFNNEIIRIGDIDRLNDYGVEILDSQHRHRVLFENIIINITISNREDKFSFDFNFHSDIQNLTEFKAKIYESPIEKLYKIALEIMKNSYELQLNGE